VSSLVSVRMNGEAVDATDAPAAAAAAAAAS